VNRLGSPGLGVVRTELGASLVPRRFNISAGRRRVVGQGRECQYERESHHTRCDTTIPARARCRSLTISLLIYDDPASAFSDHAHYS
jgi:hypothetical protein